MIELHKFHIDRLRASGLRPTKQRLAICKVLFNRKETFHFTIDKLKKGEKYQGNVSNITDYGAFVNLENNIEGLIHNQDLSWTKKNVHASKILSIQEKVDVIILDIDKEKRRISLGLKQCKKNPWEEITEEYIIKKAKKNTLVFDGRNILDNKKFNKLDIITIGK